MSEALTDDWSLSGLVIQQPGKPQGIMSKFLRMCLNLRYGLDVMETENLIEGCTTMQEQSDRILCTFVVQNQEVSSRTAVNALNQKSKVPLFLVLPRREIEKARESFAKIHNVHFVTWEDAFKRSEGSLQKTLDRVFLANRICPLLDTETPLSFPELKLNVQQRVRTLDSLPTLPQVVLRIIELIGDPDTSIDELEAVIGSDASMVWKLLEVMKSPDLAGVRRTEWTLRDVIMRLGIRKVGAIAQQIKLMNSFVKPEDSPFDLKRFWIHSLGCAMIGHKLYSEGLIDVDEELEFSDYWIAALLHDIGKLVLGLYFPKNFEDTVSRMATDAEFGRDFREAEAQVGTVGLHEDIARLLMIKADAGEQLITAVGSHHAADAASDKLVCLIHMADNLCKDLGLGYLRQERGAYNPAVLKALDLTEEKVAQLKDALGPTMVADIEQMAERSTAEKKKDRAAQSRLEMEPEKTSAELVADIRERVEGYPSVEEEQRQHMLVDIDALGLQLSRDKVNLNVALALVDVFATVDFLGDLVTQLRSKLQEEADEPPTAP